MTDAFTPERIAATREILARATSGPLQVKHDYNLEGRTTIIGNVDGEYVDGKLHVSFDFVCSTLNYGETDDPAKAKANAAAILTAITDHPAALKEIERLSAERDEARATAQKWHKAAIDNTIGEEACKQFARESVELLDSTWMRRAETAEAELSRAKAELDEAVGWLEVVGMSAGWQYMMFETRDEIRSFLSRMEGRKDG